MVAGVPAALEAGGPGTGPGASTSAVCPPGGAGTIGPIGCSDSCAAGVCSAMTRGRAARRTGFAGDGCGGVTVPNWVAPSG